MKVFISSVITGSERFRDAVEAAVESLGHEVVRAEDFGASPDTPQQACLAGVRQADVVVLLVGARYGAVQASVSAALRVALAQEKLWRKGGPRRRPGASGP